MIVIVSWMSFWIDHKAVRELLPTLILIYRAFCYLRENAPFVANQNSLLLASRICWISNFIQTRRGCGWCNLNPEISAGCDYVERYERALSSSSKLNPKFSYVRHFGIRILLFFSATKWNVSCRKSFLLLTFRKYFFLGSTNGRRESVKNLKIETWPINLSPFSLPKSEWLFRKQFTPIWAYAAAVDDLAFKFHCFRSSPQADFHSRKPDLLVWLKAVTVGAVTTKRGRLLFLKAL